MTYDVFGWAANSFGELDDGTLTDRYVPVRVHDPANVGLLSNATMADGGNEFAVALLSDGRVAAWGRNNYGVLGIGGLQYVLDRAHFTPRLVQGPDGNGFLTDVAQVATGLFHVLAVKTDGTAWAWGYNWNGALGDGTGVQRNYPGQVLGPGGVGVLTGASKVAAGRFHSLAVMSNGAVYAWGDNSQGQLGDDTINYKTAPVQVLGPGGVGFLSNVVDVACGEYSSHAVMADGTVWSWGSGDEGVLGNNGTARSRVPVQVVGPGGTGTLGGVAAVAANRQYTVLALKTDGTVFGWGANWNGELGIGNMNQQSAPVQMLGPGGTGTMTGAVDVALGSYHSLVARNDGSVWGSGYNFEGELGDGTGTNSTTPVQAVGVGGTGTLAGISKVGCGSYHSYAVASSGAMYSWGWNNYGVLGVNDPSDQTLQYTPVAVFDVWDNGFLSAVAARAGQDFSVALKADGTVWAWGEGYFSTLGQNNTVDYYDPVRVHGPGDVGYLADAAKIAVGHWWVHAIKTDGTVWGWGQNTWGMLGDGSTSLRRTPVQMHGPDNVGFMTGVADIACGYDHTVILKSDGTVYCCGTNSKGQLGDGTTGQKLYPVQVLGMYGSGYLTGIVAIAAGYYRSMAIDGSGQVYSWGYNHNGELGIGSADYSSHTTPVLVLGEGGVGNLSGVSSVGTAFESGSPVMALKTDGTVWAWGYNGSGYLGDNTLISRYTPVQVHGPGDVGFLTEVAHVGQNYNATLATKVDGSIWAWGNGYRGLCGNNIGSNTDYATPVQVHGPGDVGFLTGMVSSYGCYQHILALGVAAAPPTGRLRCQLIITGA